MRKIFLLIVAVSLIGCGGNEQKKSGTNNDEVNKAFNLYKEAFVERLWTIYPDWATGVGYHKYDTVLFIPNEETRNREINFAKAELDSLKKYDLSQLDSNNKTDHHMMANQLEAIVFYNNEYRSFEWVPSNYNIGEVFMMIMSDKEASLNDKLKRTLVKMKNIPAYYAAAKANIKNPTIEHTDLAISQIDGSKSVFTITLNDSIKKSTLSDAEKQQLTDATKTSIDAIDGYVNWIKKELRPSLDNKTARSFRLGKELHAKKFGYDIHSGYTPEQIYEKALNRKKELHGEMAKIAKELWPKYMKEPVPTNDLELIKKMIGKLSEKHVAPDSFQIAIEKQLPELEKFIKDKNLLYIDPSKPLVVRKEPDYMAGVAGASINSPGPYDKNGNTYYNVGTLSGWPKERSESYLREYNHYILQILNIHEAIPGHYTQLVYSNNSPSIIKSLFANGAMNEGWAVYTERMMLENGYGASNGAAISDPEMWLMYYKWHMRTVCNTILDYSVHVLNISKEDGLKLLMDEAFQEKAEAENKWKRASLTQVQLCSYFTGYCEIYDLREELKKKQGDKFNLKEFHEKFLSYGSSPVKYIRELMVEDVK